MIASLPDGRVGFSEAPLNIVGRTKQGCHYLLHCCCVFMCLASRAVHQEIAYNLSTDSFLVVLRHFLSVSHHTISVMYSDNGTNAKIQKGIKGINQRQTVHDRRSEKLNGNMLLHSQASIYKTMIQLVCKNVHLIIDNKQLRKFTAEGLQTSFKEIEHILNCQPLTELTDEVNAAVAQMKDYTCSSKKLNIF